MGVFGIEIGNYSVCRRFGPDLHLSPPTDRRVGKGRGAGRFSGLWWSVIEKLILGPAFGVTTRRTTLSSHTKPPSISTTTKILLKTSPDSSVLISDVF